MNYIQSQILERVDQEKWVSEETQRALPWIFAKGAYYVSSKKRLLKIKYGFQGSISNVDLGPF